MINTSRDVMEWLSRKITVGLFCCSCLCYSMAVSCRLGESLNGYSSGTGADASADSEDSSMLSETSIGGSGGSTGEDGSAGGSGGTGGGGVAEGPSCKGLAKACGDKGDKSCCSSIEVPGGKFPMGRSTDGVDQCPSSMECKEDEQPEHEVTVSSFYLDEFEVTVERFRMFVNAYDKTKLLERIKNEGAGEHPKIKDSGWKAEWNSQLPTTADALKNGLKCSSNYQTWRDTANDTEQHPINCVTWYEAFAFCAWDGGRLPTEAEWEKAAAGGDENRLYPWGSDKPDELRAAYGWLYDGDSGRSFADIAKVGMLPAGAGRWGHKDLAGNLWEWVLDGYDANWYNEGGNLCTNCASPISTSFGVHRGGSFVNPTARLRAAYRNDYVPAYRGDVNGFRCARDK